MAGNPKDDRYGRKCHICKRGFSQEEWNERHSLHVEGCSREGCDCDYPVHASHCPECDETSDRAFWIVENQKNKIQMK